MQSSLSYNDGQTQFDRVNRLLRLQNVTTQLELLLKKLRDLESLEKYGVALSLDRNDSVHSASQARS